ncbi:MAG: formate dehydrogenase accessory sulfurtransferase FdhD [Spirochaetia bacterium]|nr:formate dehydrogenase accessory sulfurtransferase FdhD [Spirochaetia bacterium]
MSTSNINIIRYQKGRSEHVQDTVVREDWLYLYVNDILLLQAPVSGQEVEELIYGYLFVEGYLKVGERLSLQHEHETWRTTLGREVKNLTMKELVDCAASKIEFGEEIEPLPPGPVVAVDTILDLLADFQRLPSLYHSTGGVHMAAFAGAKNRRILYSADDISRRNAVDKVIGKVFLGEGGDRLGGGKSLRGESSFKEGLLLVSGRISSDIVVRMLRTGIPILVSKSAPTAKAVELAEAYGVTLCGFARGRRVNIYTRPERVARSG